MNKEDRAEYYAKWRRENAQHKKEIDHQYYLKNKEKSLRQSKGWKKENPERHKENKKAEVKRYRERYPEKCKARHDLYHAVTSGRIIRPDHCEFCFKECKPEGHHADYLRPLDVDWLCSVCHREVHKREVLV